VKLAETSDVMRNERAVQWSVRVSMTDLAPADWSDFQVWLEEDAGNEPAFQRAQAVWQRVGSVSDRPEIISYRVDALDWLRRTNRLRWAKPYRSRWHWALATAASVALLLFSSAYMLSSTVRAFDGVAGHDRHVQFADGSGVSLRPGARVSIDADDKRHIVMLLSGSADVIAAPGQRRPLIVTAGSRSIIASDARFSITMTGQDFRLRVKSGHIALADAAGLSVASASLGSSGGPTVAAAGQELMWDSGAGVAQIHEADDLGLWLFGNDADTALIGEPLETTMRRAGDGGATGRWLSPR